MEFAWNDALYDGFAAGWTVGGETAMDPLQAMERILLRLRRERPRTRPVILSVCPPADQGAQGPATAVVTRCSTLFDRLSVHYAVAHVKLLGADVRRGGGGVGGIAWDPLHPDGSGHAAIAQLLAPHLSAGPYQAPDAPPPLALHLGEGGLAERPGGAWNCRSCDWSSCGALQPNRTSGFSVQKPHWSTALARAPSLDARRRGWVGSQRDASIAFAVPGRARIVLGFLCSYESVGVARVRLLPLAHHPHHHHLHAGARAIERLEGERGTEREREALFNLKWLSNSSQQCFAQAGTTGRGPHELQISVASDGRGPRRNQVKLFSLLSQSAWEGPVPMRRF